MVERDCRFVENTILFSDSGGFALEIKRVNGDGSYTIYSHRKKGSFLYPLEGAFDWKAEQIKQFLKA